MPGDRERERDNSQYCRTTCGLIGFIVFFLGSFVAFIIAGETGKYYEYAIVIGVVLLFATVICFCFVVHESSRMHPLEFDERQAEQELLLQPQPEPELSEQSGGTENNYYSENIPLQNMTEPSARGEEPVPGTSRESQDNDTMRHEDASDSQFESTQAGPSTHTGKSFDPKYDDIPFMDKSSLHTSKSSIDTEEKQENISTALSRLSLDNSERKAASMSSQDPSCTDSGSKSEDRSQHFETSIKEGGESKLQSKKD